MQLTGWAEDSDPAASFSESQNEPTVFLELRTGSQTREILKPWWSYTLSPLGDNEEKISPERQVETYVMLPLSLKF